MKYSTGLLGFGVAVVGGLAFAGCGNSDSGAAAYFGGSGGAGGGAAGAPGGAAGSGTPGAGGVAGTAGSSGAVAAGGASAGTGGLDQSGGSAGLSGGVGGASAGTGGAGTAGAGMAGASAGSGGAPVVINPAIVLLDTILLRPKATTGTGGAGGTAGAGGAAGGAGTAGGGGTPTAGAGGASGSAGAGGSGGAPVVVDHSRSYTFDADLQMWALHAEGSTPNIGTSGGAEKLSAQSALSLNATDGVPKLGSMQISIPFSHTGEQLDVNQYFAAAGVSAEEDWSSYELVAKIKLALGGDRGTCLGAWIYATSEGFIFARSPEVLLKPADGWVDLRFDLDAPDSGVGQTVIPPSTAGFDKTKINQFGIMVESYHCP